MNNSQASIPASAAPANPHARAPRRSRHQAALVLAALGVVYGDIGTSPLYAVRQAVLATGGELPDRLAVMGAISLIFWSLVIVVTIKYVIFVLHGDNKGEGGVMSLAALAHRSPGLPRWIKTGIGWGAVIGIALFFGDGLLTPAISVLSALEGISYEDPGFSGWILPLALVILVGLFVIQSRGTAKIGKLFGPVMVLWFVTLGVLGVISVVQTPSILSALNPYYGISLFAREPTMAFVSLGSVVLAITGVEALYADMGHFGASAIRIAWRYLTLPGLVLNYLGQGAALLADPGNIDNPFYALAPGSLHYPLVALATFATVIASQAVISGVFSLTQQAVQLGYLPRMEIRHTSATDFGQVYAPRANMMLMIGVIAVVLVYKNSDALGAAYGMAIVGMMTITTLLLLVVAIKHWRWKPYVYIPLFGLFLLVDLAFLSSVSLKLFEGAWMPLAIAVAMFIMIDTWRAGRRALLERTTGHGFSTDMFLERAEKKTPLRVAGTAVYLSPRIDVVPGSLLHNLKHNQVLHERVVLLRVIVDDTPFVAPEKRIDVEKLGKGFYGVELHFGYFEDSDVPRALEQARPFGLVIDIDTTTFFVHHETLVKAKKSALSTWRTRLFITLSGQALEAARFFKLPPGRVVELGTQIEI